MKVGYITIDTFMYISGKVDFWNYQKYQSIKLYKLGTLCVF